MGTMVEVSAVIGENNLDQIKKPEQLMAHIVRLVLSILRSRGSVM